MPETKKKKYTCAHCGGTFIEGWSDEEAVAEAKQEWGVKDANTRADMAVICDDCYQALMAWRNRPGAP